MAQLSRTLELNRLAGPAFEWILIWLAEVHLPTEARAFRQAQAKRLAARPKWGLFPGRQAAAVGTR
jgi:hypothetical protein